MSLSHRALLSKRHKRHLKRRHQKRKARERERNVCDLCKGTGESTKAVSKGAYHLLGGLVRRSLGGGCAPALAVAGRGNPLSAEQGHAAAVPAGSLVMLLALGLASGYVLAGVVVWLAGNYANSPLATHAQETTGSCHLWRRRWGRPIKHRARISSWPVLSSSSYSTRRSSRPSPSCSSLAPTAAVAGKDERTYVA